MLFVSKLVNIYIYVYIYMYMCVEAIIGKLIPIGKLYNIQPNTYFYVDVLQEKWTRS